MDAPESMDVPESIQLFYQADWITFGIRKRLNLSPLKATILLCLLCNTVLLIAAIHDNIVFSNDGRLGFLNDYSWWISTFLGYSVVAYTFLWLPGGITETISGLIKNKVIKIPASHKDGREALDIYIRKFFKSYSNPLWYIIFSVMVIPLLIGLATEQKESYMSWITASNFIFGFELFIFVLHFFFFIILLIRTVVAINWLNRLFKDFDVDVRVLHPDSAGGLAPISRFSTVIVYTIAAAAIANVSGDILDAAHLGKAYIDCLVTQPFSLFFFISYCIFAPIVFFAPLTVAHTAMKRAKDEFITKLSDQYEIEISHINTLLVGDSVELKDSLSKLAELQELHNIASKFPVWPFNTSNLVRLFGSIVAPLLLSFISILMEHFFK
ncbi:MAG: hypothetical protein WA821_11490 [Anaerolineales bacterium]